MSRFRFRPWMALAGVLALLVIFFATTFFVAGLEERKSAEEGAAGSEGRNTAVEGAVGSVASPAVSGSSGFASSVKEFVLRLFGARDVDKEYEQLKIRVQQLETANQIMQDLQLENERLMELLGYAEKYPNYEYIPARVTGRVPGSWFFYFDLNRGSNDGVKKNMTVVNQQGLVGTVIKVGPTWCQVMAIIDRTSAVSVVVERSRDQGMLHGSGDPQAETPICEVHYLPKEAEVVPGDKVVTSDFDSISLKGIPVGTIAEVGRGGDRIITVIPYVDFAHLENVLIIRKEKPLPAATPTASPESEPGGTKPPEGEPGGTKPPESGETGEGKTAAPTAGDSQQGEPDDKGGEGN